MAEIKRTISADDRLKYLGLMTLASEHKHKADEFERAACALVGVEIGGAVSDAIWGSMGPGALPRAAEYDDALLREGVGVDG